MKTKTKRIIKKKEILRNLKLNIMNMKKLDTLKKLLIIIISAVSAKNNINN